MAKTTKTTTVKKIMKKIMKTRKTRFVSGLLDIQDLRAHIPNQQQWLFTLEPGGPFFRQPRSGSVGMYF